MKKDRYLQLVIAIGLVFTCFTVYMINQVKYLGSSEDAGYTLIAKNIATGEGFTSHTVLFFFEKYPSITHPDDTAPPLYSLILAGLFRVFGVHVLLAKLPSIFFNCMLLPIVVFLLARRIVNPFTAFAAALFVMFSPISYATSMHSEVESLFAVCIVSSALMFIKGLESNKHFIVMGVFIGLSFLTKYTGILTFAAALIAYFYLVFMKKTRYTKFFLFGILAGIVVISPWLVRNIILFGDPLHTVNENGSVAGSTLIQKAVYWDTKMPSFFEYLLSNGLMNYKMYLSRIIRLIMLFLPIHIVAIIGLLVMNPRKVSFIAAIYFMFAIFHILVVNAYYDYFIGVISLLTIPSLYFILEYIPKHMRFLDKTIKFGTVCLIVLMFLYLASKFFINASILDMKISKAGFPFVDSPVTDSIMDAAAWAKNNLPPNTGVMVKKPRGFSFYSGLPTVYLVPDGYDKVLEVANYYNISFVQCELPMFAGHEANLSVIYKNPNFSLCKIIEQ